MKASDAFKRTATICFAFAIAASVYASFLCGKIPGLFTVVFWALVISFAALAVAKDEEKKEKARRRETTEPNTKGTD